MDLATAPRGELVSLIYELIDKVHLLEAENANLRELLKRKGEKTKSPGKLPDFVKANVASKEPKERKQRDESYHREKEVATERVFHTLECCPNCGGILGKPAVSYSREVIEIPQVSYKIVEHVVYKRWCFHCKKRFAPKVDFSPIALGQGRIGLNLASTVVVMKDRLRLPIPVIQSYLKIFYQLSLSKGEIVSLLHLTAKRGKKSYGELLEEIRGSPMVHADETGGRQSGKNGYFWSFSTPSVHFLLYRQSRGAKVVEEIVGKESDKFAGVLVSDFYTAYNTYTGFHQRCWVHLLRDIKELSEQTRLTDPKNSEVSSWAEAVKAVYEEAKTYSGPEESLPIGLKADQRIQKQKEFEDRLRNICQSYLTRNSPQSILCGRIINYLPELFVFVRFSEVHPDNNAAERILRHTVIARKISYGTRSPQGSETKTILTSLFDTWHLRGLNPLTQCRLLLATCQ